MGEFNVYERRQPTAVRKKSRSKGMCKLPHSAGSTGTDLFRNEYEVK